MSIVKDFKHLYTNSHDYSLNYYCTLDESMTRNAYVTMHAGDTNAKLTYPDLDYKTVPATFPVNVEVYFKNDSLIYIDLLANMRLSILNYTKCKESNVSDTSVLVKNLQRCFVKNSLFKQKIAIVRVETMTLSTSYDDIAEFDALNAVLKGLPEVLKLKGISDIHCILIKETFVTTEDKKLELKALGYSYDETLGYVKIF